MPEAAEQAMTNLRTRFPEYDDIPDGRLAFLVSQKYPEYKKVFKPLFTRVDSQGRSFVSSDPEAVDTERQASQATSRINRYATVLRNTAKLQADSKDETAFTRAFKSAASLPAGLIGEIGQVVGEKGDPIHASNPIAHAERLNERKRKFVQLLESGSGVLGSNPSHTFTFMPGFAKDGSVVRRSQDGNGIQVVDKAKLVAEAKRFGILSKHATTGDISDDLRELRPSDNPQLVHDRIYAGPSSAENVSDLAQNLPAESVAHKAADIAGGLAGAIGELIALRKALPKKMSPKMQMAAAFELQGQLHGDPTGKGAALGLALGGIGSIPAQGFKAKVAQVAAESGAFAGISAFYGAEEEELIVAALLPLGLRGTAAGANLIKRGAARLKGAIDKNAFNREIVQLKQEIVEFNKSEGNKFNRLVKTEARVAEREGLVREGAEGLRKQGHAVTGDTVKALRTEAERALQGKQPGDTSIPAEGKPVVSKAKTPALDQGAGEKLLAAEKAKGQLVTPGNRKPIVGAKTKSPTQKEVIAEQNRKAGGLIPDTPGKPIISKTEKKVSSRQEQQAKANLGIDRTGRTVVTRGTTPSEAKIKEAVADAKQHADIVKQTAQGEGPVKADVGTTPGGKLSDLLKDETGALTIEQLANSAIGRGVRKAGGAVAAAVRPRGNLPQGVFDRSVRMTGQMLGDLDRTRQLLDKLKRSLVKTAGKDWAKQKGTVRAVSEVMAGTQPPEILPREVRRAVSRARDHIDYMTRRLIESGAVEDSMIPVLQGNLGSYMKRTYKVFRDKGWTRELLEKNHPEIITNARNWFREHYRNRSSAEVEGLIDAFLERGNNSIAGFFKNSKLGSKDLGILTKRKDIPEPIRQLWGEDTNPVVRYAQSVASMSELVAKHEFLTNVRKQGLGKFFFEKPTTNAKGKYIHKIAGDQSKVMEPLNGLHTTKEIATAFEEAMGSKELGKIARFFMGLNTLAKTTKTVFNPITHTRNLVGGGVMNIANGRFDVTKAKRAVDATWAELFKGSGGKKIQAYNERMTRLGITNESALGSEFTAMMRDSLGKNFDSFLVQNRRKTLARSLTAVPRGVGKLYQAEDNINRVFAFEVERARYAKAMPKASAVELDRLAANIVRNTYPTYSMAPKVVKMLRRVPIVGTFTAFNYEVLRTGGNTLALAAREIASQNPAIRAIGVKRAVGVAIAGSIPMAIAEYSAQFISGMSPEQDEAARRGLPPWAKNSIIAWLGKDEDGNRKYLNLSYTNPYAPLTDAAMAVANGESLGDKVMGGMKELFPAFLDEGLVTQKILDISRNRDDEGRRIVNDQDPDKMSKMVYHFLEGITPGIINEYVRIEKGLKGDERYDPESLIQSIFTGHRVSLYRPRRTLSFKAAAFKGDTAEASQLFVKQLKSPEKLTGADIDKAYRDANEAKERLWLEMRKDYKAAIMNGVSPQDAAKVIQSSGMSNRDVQAVVDNEYRPYLPSLQTLKNAIDRFSSTEQSPEKRRELKAKLMTRFARAVINYAREKGETDAEIKRRETEMKKSIQRIKEGSN